MDNENTSDDFHPIRDLHPYTTGLVAGGSGIYAYATTPALTDIQGAFGSAMIGAGTSLTMYACAVAGSCVGAAVGAGLSALFKGKAAEKTVKSCGLAAGLLSGIYGIPQGYDASKDIVLNGIDPDATNISVEAEETTTPSLDYVIAEP